MNAVRWEFAGQMVVCCFYFGKKRCALLVIRPTLQGSPFRNCEIPCMLRLTQLHLRLSGLTMVHSGNKETK